MLTRPIPHSGEPLPILGLGTFRAFDQTLAEPTRQALAKVLAGLFEAGGSLIDSSPMYGRAEAVTGELLEA
jgi:aryl-alcohol dehydrogenase-like predicted oxidoreductase